MRSECNSMESGRKRKISELNFVKSTGVKKRKKRSRESCYILQSTPHDIMFEVLIRLGSSSFIDLCNLKQSCKELNELGKDTYIFRHIPLEGLKVQSWEHSDELVSFLLQCEVSDNPEALYRHGMVEYYQNSKPDLACELFERALKFGHDEATYMLSMILLSKDDVKQRQRGIELIKDLETKKQSRNINLSDSREKCKRIIRQLWRNNVICRERALCSNQACKMKEPIVVPQESDENQYNFCSETCKWDYELILFINMQQGLLNFVPP